MAIQVGGVTVIDNSKNVIAAAGASLTAGDSFVLDNAVGLGKTTTTGRDAGIGTATGTLIYNTSNRKVEVWDGGTWIGGLESFSLSSPTVTADTSTRPGWAVFTFTSPGSVTVLGPAAGGTVEYLVVAGGGSGGYGYFGGGGGAGGMRTGTLPLTPGSYPISIGGGGSHPSPGSPSTFSTITSTGGGQGGNGNNGSGSPGGSGGGGSGNDNQPFPYPGPEGRANYGAGNTPPVSPPQGNRGGGGNRGATDYGGGGGGAGGVGGSNVNGNGQAQGGIGAPSSITGVDVTYAGGGTSYNGPIVGGGIPGGGGYGAGSPPGSPWVGTPQHNGQANTGGGGGSGHGTVTGAGGNGGSGTVIIAYQIS